MGKRKKKQQLKDSVIAIREALVTPAVPMTVVTPGGRIQVQWDKKANATAMGQLAFFAEFLETTGLLTLAMGITTTRLIGRSRELLRHYPRLMGTPGGYVPLYGLSRY